MIIVKILATNFSNFRLNFVIKYSIKIDDDEF